MSTQTMVSQPIYVDNFADDIIEKYYDDGTYYRGTVKNGMRNGYGIFIYLDKSRYEGEWENDMRQGKGKLYFSTDNKQGYKIFYGDWKNDSINGYGFLVLNNGLIHKGLWYNNTLIGVSE